MLHKMDAPMDLGRSLLDSLVNTYSSATDTGYGVVWEIPYITTLLA